MMSEHDHQVEVFNWAKLHEGIEPRLKLLYAVPNGGHRNKITAARLKAEGVKPGMPDICLPVSHKKTYRFETINDLTIDDHRVIYHALYIELKKPKCDGGKKPTKVQQKMIELLREEFNHVRVCYGYSEAIAAIKKYLGMK